MATVLGEIEGTVETPSGRGSYDETLTGYLFGFPGNGLTAACPFCSLDWKVTVYSNLDVVLKLTGYFAFDDVSGPLIGWEDGGDQQTIWINKDPFTIYRTGDSTDEPWPDSAVAAFRVWVEGSGKFSGNLVDSTFNLGKLTDYVDVTSGQSQDGHLYIGGVAWGYAVTNDLVIQSIDVTIPGIRMYLEYYPWTVRHGDGDDGKWMSCNREGGYVLRRDGRVWVKEKNRDNDADHSVVFTRNASTWAIAPRIGQE